VFVPHVVFVVVVVVEDSVKAFKFTVVGGIFAVLSDQTKIFNTKDTYYTT